MSFSHSLGLPHLPQVVYAGSDTVESPSYHWDGRGRSGTPYSALQYTIDGCGILKYHGKDYGLEKGKAFVINLYDPEACYFYPPSSKEPWKFIFCVFSNLNEQVEGFNAAQGPLLELGKDSVVVKRLMLLLEPGEPPFHSSLAPSESYSLCAAIVEELCRNMEINYAEAKGESLVRKAKEIMYMERHSTFSLGRLAAKLEVSPEHTCREFKKLTGMTPKGFHDYLTAENIRMELSYGGKPLKEVAKMFGFSDVSNFVKFFKRQHATTPAKYRNTGKKAWRSSLG